MNYLVDESFVYPQVVSEYDDLGTVTTEYHRGLGLISMTKEINEYNYRYDALGSVRALSVNGEITDTYDYDTYGELKTHNGTTENSYLYTGEQYDEETGNYYLRARYYNPTAGQFISRDSWEGDDRNPVTLNKYAYANSNPVMYTDPTGHFAMAEVYAIQAISDVMAQASEALGFMRMVPSSGELAEEGKAAPYDGKLFLHPTLAAWNVLGDFINPTWTNVNEYGGWIVKYYLIFYATIPVEGKKLKNNFGAEIDPKDYPNPKKGEIKASYHTHYNPDLPYFSGHEGMGDIKTFGDMEIDHYLGNVHGEMWMWEKSKQKDGYRGKMLRLTLPIQFTGERLR